MFICHFRFAEAFSIFCGMAIRNAADYEKAVLSEAKLQVAFEVMNRLALSVLWSKYLGNALANQLETRSVTGLS